MNSELLAAAQAYHEKGIPVIPFILTWNDKAGRYDKDNIGTWKKWITEPQTDEEFNSLCWVKDGKEANAFGIIPGVKMKDGRYIGIIDFDVKPIIQQPNETEEAFKIRLTEQEEAIRIGKEIVSELPPTTTEQTCNKGTHSLFYSRHPFESDGDFHDKAALELIGTKKPCLMAPSLGYHNIGSDLIAEVDHLDQIFYNLLQKHNCLPHEETEEEKANRLDKFGFDIRKLIDISGFSQLGPNEFQGKHPIHDSTTEKNFCVNIKDNTWHCFRHNTGGGVLQYLAMQQGIIKCEDAKKGALKGKKFKDVIELAVAQQLIPKETLQSPDELNPVLIAKEIMQDYHFATDLESNKLYVWMQDDGIYADKTEQIIKREMVKRLRDQFKSRFYTDINDYITNSAPLVIMNGQNPELLAVNNGLLNVFTRELRAFSPEIYITAKLDVNYDETKQGTNFKKFLDQVQPDIKLQRQLKQLIGHCLYRKIITETALILLGSGENGKSIFLDAIKCLLGHKNIGGHSIQQLCYDKFIPIEIRDKLANICTDLPHKELFNTGTYKALVSGDVIQGYTKHVQHSIPFTPYTKYLYSANAIPPIKSEEDGYAWYRRFIIIPFTITFSGNKKRPRQELLNELTTPEELSAALNWALEGLTELQKQGEISDKPTPAEIRKEYRKHSSSTIYYFDECTIITDNETDFVFTDSWFRDYVTFCHETGK